MTDQTQPYRPRWLARPKGWHGLVYQFVVVWPGDILGLVDHTIGALTCGFIRPDLSMKWMMRYAIRHSRWVRRRIEATAQSAPSEQS